MLADQADSGERLADDLPADPLIVVSNRLPVKLHAEGRSWTAKPSSGGLVAALSGVLRERRTGSCWVGWPGCEVPAPAQDQVRAVLAGQHMAPVFLTRDQEQHYYRGMCNDVLWPLFHYFADKVSYQPADWDSFVAINRAFADTVLAIAGSDHRVWVHDFHLMLVPGMLREARPDLTIGFFLHIPWPSSELYRLLPPRQELLRGILGADYVGFHTSDYARHFQFSCLRVLGLEADPDGIVWEDRRIGIGRHPIGIDVHHFREVMSREKTKQLREELRNQYEHRGRKLLLGIERLDYSKGILLKLRAFEALLERRPELARQAVLMQVIVPSRVGVLAYQELKREIEEAIGHINGRHGRPGATPIEYMYRNLSPEQLVALYQAADVGLVTPVRDGMNLVAQEFVLCQENERGMLVLSEFAGAAQGLSNAILVNPWNRLHTADAIERALEMTAEQRDERMKPMAERVARIDCNTWAQGFLTKLEVVADRRRTEQAFRRRRHLTGDLREDLLIRAAEAPRRLLVLDYDGTLQDIKATPERARPSQEILTLLSDLSELDDTQVHLVSGRQSEVLERWFGGLGDRLHMCAEHGSVNRPASGDWCAEDFDMSWKPQVEAMLREAVAEVPGTMVEVKHFSVAWHYRNADPEQGTWAATGLQLGLESELQHMGVEIIQGRKLLEVRPAGANKGNYVTRITRDLPEDTLVLCLGDDRTDLDMYRALPAGAISIQVGQFADDTNYYLGTPQEARALLRELVTRCRAGGSSVASTIS